MSNYNFNPADLETFTVPLTEDVQDNDVFNEITEEYVKESRIVFLPSDKNFVIHDYETEDHGKVKLTFKAMVANIHHKCELKQIIVNNPNSPDDFTTSRTFFMPRVAYFNDKKGNYTSPISGKRMCDDFTTIRQLIGKDNVKFYDAFRFRISAFIPKATYTVVENGRENSYDISNITINDISLAYKISSKKSNETVLKDFEKALNGVMNEARKLLNGIRAAGRNMDTSGILFEFYVGSEHPNKYIDKQGKEQTNTLNYLGVSLTQDIADGNLAPYKTAEYIAIMEYLTTEVEYTGFVQTDKNTKLQYIDEETRTITEAEAIRQEQMKFVLGTTDNENYKRSHENTMKGLGYEPTSQPSITHEVVEATVVDSADDLLAE